MTAATVIPGGVVLRGDVCDEPCGHRDCATGWQIVRAECVWCCEPIGFGQDYREDPEGLHHQACWSERYESKPEAYGTSVGEWFPCPEAVQWAVRS